MNKTILILLILIPSYCFAQVKNIGTPSIVNYSKSTYKAGTQNWDISQDEKGFMYFANNNGVLRFDGFHWELLDTNIPLPVRSLYVDSKGRIFVGLIDNFGILELNNDGKYKFKSLRYLFDESIGFSDVWRIHEIQQGIVFQSFERLFIYDNKKITVFNPKEKYRFSFNINGRLLVQEHGYGLYEYFNGYFEKVPWADPLLKNEIVSILEIGENHLLIGTANGFYKYDHGRLTDWDCAANDFIKTNKLFTSASIVGNHLALGTILNGVIISDVDGNIIQHLNRDKGLLNNTILSLYPDRDNNLWLGLDNGIDYIEINSPISYVSDGGNIGTGYCCIIHDDKLYMGTNQGLFVKPFSSFSNSNENFRLIENTEGQVWSLTIHKDQLICGHNFGTFVIKGATAKKIGDEPGGWTYIRSGKNPNLLIGGFYSGLALFKYDSGEWTFQKKIKGFTESSRFLFEDKKGDFWIGHSGKGVYKVTPNEQLDSIINYTLYNSDSGLPSDDQNIILTYKDIIYISTIDGFYQYNESENNFSSVKEMIDLFGNIGRIKTIKTDENENIWYISQNESGVLRQNEDLTYTKITSPFKNLQGHFVNEFEFIYPVNNDHVFIGIDDGFAHYTTKFPKFYELDYNSYITKIEVNYLDSVIYPQNQTIHYQFPYKRNAFRFHYTSPFFENLHDLQFSYYLENYSEDWSAWSPDTYKDFTNLRYGHYLFKIKAINSYSVESETHEFEFDILPPWYQSSIAYVVYIILLVLILFLIILLVRYRMKKTKEREEQKHKKELQEKDEILQHQSVVAEKEIIKLRNDKLRVEMTHRDKELANQTNNIIQKNRFLMKLNLELSRISKETSDGSVRSRMSVLKKKIDKEIDSEQQNKIFETYFDDAHKDFFERLKKDYPQLSPKDLRLCAYVKMNISTKEIATLLNISDRGVEISRYRLRKKMELPRETNLSTFLAGI